MDEIFARTDIGGERYFLADALGSTIALTDQAGNLQTQYTYGPFGETIGQGAPATNPYLYTGREFESSRLYYYRARYYHPILQRFISEDSLGFAGGDPNLYGYVFNDPVNLLDPYGLLGCFGDGTFRATVPTASIEASGRIVLGTEKGQVNSALAAGIAFTPFAGGAAAGRGAEFGCFRGDISSFLNSTAVNIDTPLGGLSLFFDDDGRFVGLGFGGPSAGLGATFTGPKTSIGIGVTFGPNGELSYTYPPPAPPVTGRKDQDTTHSVPVLSSGLTPRRSTN